MFQMDDRMWNVFLQTGNIEAYLLIKQMERTSVDGKEENEQDASDIHFELKH